MRGALVLTGLLAACAMPERVRETPELSGTLTKSGAPVAAARITLVASEALARPSCEGALTSRKTDKTGAFEIGSRRRWKHPREADPPRDGSRRLRLCVRESGTQADNPLFALPITTWDTLELACDLDRAWLTGDAAGSEGRCTQVHAALDGQHVATPAVGTRSPALTCDTASALISDLRVGPLRVNGSVAELRRLCPGLRDTVVQEDSPVGMLSEQAHVLTIAGAPVIIRRASGVIFSLAVASPGPRTADSIAVGTPVRALLRRPDLYVVSSAMNQGMSVFAWHGSGCGLGYSLSRREQEYGDMNAKPIPSGRLREWPETTSVRRIVVGFCPDREFGELLKQR